MIAKDPKKAPYWMFSNERACAQVGISGSAKFFPEKGQSSAEAKRICLGCPFRTECLDYAIVFDMEGVWGGTTSKQRKERFSREVRAIIRDDYFAA